MSSSPTPSVRVNAPRRLRTAGIAMLSLLILGTGAWTLHGLFLGDAGSGATESVGADVTDLSSPSWYQIKPRSFDLTVMASGELDAKNKVEIKSLVDGQTTITEIIPEGTSVKQGDILVKLADDDIRDKIEQANLDVEKAKADQTSAQQLVEITQNQADSDLKAAQVKLELAQLDLAKWANGDVPQTRQNLELDLEKAKRTLVVAKRDVELSKTLFEEKFISQTDLEKDQIAEIEAENALLTANLNMKVFQDYTKPTDEKKHTSDVEQAQAEVERTKRKNQSQIETVTADCDSKVRTLKIRQEKLAKLEEQLRNTIVTAPQKGLVVYSTSMGPANRRAQPMIQGRQVRFNESMIILPDTRQMVAVLKVNEAVVGQVKVGQSVTVTIDATPTKPLDGKVISIGVIAEDGGWMNPDLREYAVRIELPEDAGGKLKPAMRATGEITIGRVENTLAVPVQAVFTEGEDRFCFVPSMGGHVRKIPVSVGRANESFAEIIKGLAEGDRVLLRRPRPGEQVG